MRSWSSSARRRLIAAGFWESSSPGAPAAVSGALCGVWRFIELALPALALGLGLAVERGHWSLYGAAGVTASLVVAYLFRHLVPLSRIEVVGQPATD